ncbi:MAG: radical SAM protein [Elusimicrobia bacterium]|nr:radical SAM protein [Elusimicrobiota bacterium]
MKKFNFSLLWDCNEDCLFCAKGHVPPGVKSRFSSDEVLKTIFKKRKEGFRFISFDGGEPTLMKDLPKFIAFAVKCGFKEVDILTNAVLLSDLRILNKIKAYDLHKKIKAGFSVSLHSHKEKVSDYLTASKNTFQKTLKGIENILKCGFTVSIYHVIASQNYKDLPNFAEFVLRKFPAVDNITFSYIYPVSHKFATLKDIYPKLLLVRPYLKKAVEILKKNDTEARLSSCGIIPPCLMKGIEYLLKRTHQEDNIESITCDTSRTDKFPFFSEIFNKENKIKSPKCANCAVNDFCGGIWKFYADIYGLKELKPYKKSPLK